MLRPVTVAEVDGFAVDLESALGGGRGEQLESADLEIVQCPAAVGPTLMEPSADSSSWRSSRRTLVHVGAEAEFRHGEGRAVGIAQHEQRIDVAAEPAAVKPGCGGPPAPSLVMNGKDT